MRLPRTCLEDFVRRVDDRGGRARRADEAHVGKLCGELDGPLGGHGVRRVEDGAVGDRAEQGDVFQSLDSFDQISTLEVQH